MKMKLPILFLFLLASVAVFGQRLSKYENYSVKRKNHVALYERAKRLIEFNRPDSSHEAVRILRALNGYDSSKYSMNLFKPLLEKMEKANRTFYQQTIIGRWKFEWSGTNWGTTSTSDSTNEVLVFTDKEVIFYRNDTIQRRTPYQISNSNVRSYFYASVFFRIVFQDNNNEWPFWFYDHTDFVPYISKTKTVAMRISEEPFCSCGCPEQVFSKIVDECKTSIL
jgi:hypothetical protein